MTDTFLKRRPTWYRYLFIMGVITFLYMANYYHDWELGRTEGGMPFWVIPVGAALFSFAALSEMCATVRWNDKSVQMFARWGFSYLGGKTFTVQMADIISVSDGYMSVENTKGLPFTTIEITDGYDAVRIRTDAFFREGMQALVADIARLRPDLELTDNLKAYVRGDFDGDWVK